LFLAKNNDCPLASFDKKLLEAAKKEGVEVLE
jgi:predicted nucleic acid-binding protein